MFDCCDLVTVQIELLEVHQAIKCAARNRRDFVVVKTELDQILARAEAFDGRDLILAQINLFDKHPGFVQPLDLFDVLVSKADLFCLANTRLRVPHLNDVRARVFFLRIWHMVVAETIAEHPQFKSLLWVEHGDDEHEYDNDDDDDDAAGDDDDDSDDDEEGDGDDEDDGDDGDDAGCDDGGGGGGDGDDDADGW